MPIRSVPGGPSTGVQRGSVQFLFKYPGDPETPGVASTPDLPDSARISPDGNQPHIISIPLSYHDAAPILEALKGPGVPQGWQGALPFRYHLGPGGVKRPPRLAAGLPAAEPSGTSSAKSRARNIPTSSVINGNHRDAWVYGAVDPNSGTAAMLEAVHGIGALLKQGWRPKRTILFCSWDAEEEGLIGSTEWVEQHAAEMDHAVAYFNTDVGVAGPDFTASAVPSLKEFVRDVTRSVPSPLGGTVYQEWRLNRNKDEHRASNAPPQPGEEVHVSDLGSGSDFTPFLQHAGVPSTDVGSGGPYGVYHSAFDNYAWFTMNADPHFVYLQEMARVFGLEALRMADADVLPYDYVAYAREITAYIDAAKRKAHDDGFGSLDFAPAQAAAQRFSAAAAKAHAAQTAPAANPEQLAQLNAALRKVETDLLSPEGLPNRPWYRHTIYAPGEYTGYSAVVIPGVNEAIDAQNSAARAQAAPGAHQALDRAAQTLDSIH